MQTNRSALLDHEDRDSPNRNDDPPEHPWITDARRDRDRSRADVDTAWAAIDAAPSMAALLNLKVAEGRVAWNEKLVDCLQAAATPVLLRPSTDAWDRERFQIPRPLITALTPKQRPFSVWLGRMLRWWQLKGRDPFRKVYKSAVGASQETGLTKKQATLAAMHYTKPGPDGEPLIIVSKKKLADKWVCAYRVNEKKWRAIGGRLVLKTLTTPKRADAGSKVKAKPSTSKQVKGLDPKDAEAPAALLG